MFSKKRNFEPNYLAQDIARRVTLPSKPPPDAPRTVDENPTLKSHFLKWLYDYIHSPPLPEEHITDFLLWAYKKLSERPWDFMEETFYNEVFEKPLKELPNQSADLILGIHVGTSNILYKNSLVTEYYVWEKPLHTEQRSEDWDKEAENMEKLLLGYDNRGSVIQTQAARDRHTYIIGKSGSGKTTLLRNMIFQDLQLGNGLGVIAPEQEMITEEIMPFIPEERLNDVIYFNPADENPIPFNPLNLGPDEDPGLKANEIMTIFKRIIGGESTPRIGQILYQLFYALIMAPKTTLLDVRKFLNRDDPDFREQVISQIQDEECIEFWRDDYPQFDKSAHLPILYRVGAFTRDKRIRNILCGVGESFNFRQAMDTGKVVLFNLSDGILGEQNSQFLGQLIVSQFQLAVSSRASIPEQQRRRFYLYIDEFQTFTSGSADSYAMILSRARKYRLALIFAHQQTGQLPRELLMDIFGNVSTMISFMVSHHDATKLSKEFIIDGQPIPPEQFVDLEIGETFCKLGKESFKMKTPLVTQKPNWDIKEKIIEQSRQQFTSDTPTPTASSKLKPAEQPGQPAPDEPLITKPKIKPTGKIK